MARIKLDKPVRKIWNLNQLHIGDCFVGIPQAEYYKNKKGNQFICLMLDAGYSTLHIYYLIFEFPKQKILNSKFHNSFELVRFYRNVAGEGIDERITTVHDIDWQEIIGWLNSLNTLKIKVTGQSMNGFKNIRFVGFTRNSLAEEVDFQKWIL